jgi:hypothetical protein
VIALSHEVPPDTFFVAKACFVAKSFPLAKAYITTVLKSPAKHERWTLANLSAVIRRAHETNSNCGRVPSLQAGKFCRDLSRTSCEQAIHVQFNATAATA